jgi:hypothetical protein
VTARSARFLFTLAVCLPPQAICAGGLNDIVNTWEYSATPSSSGQPDKAQLKTVRDSGFERVVYLAFSDNDSSLPNENRVVKDMNSVWVPNETWRELIFSILEENSVSPNCDTCLWEGGQANMTGAAAEHPLRRFARLPFCRPGVAG